MQSSREKEESSYLAENSRVNKDKAPMYYRV